MLLLASSNTYNEILQISFILFVTCALVGVHYGTGRHHKDLKAEQIVQAMKVR